MSITLPSVPYDPLVDYESFRCKPEGVQWFLVFDFIAAPGGWSTGLGAQWEEGLGWRLNDSGIGAVGTANDRQIAYQFGGIVRITDIKVSWANIGYAGGGQKGLYIYLNDVYWATQQSGATVQQDIVVDRLIDLVRLDTFSIAVPAYITRVELRGLVELA